MIDAAAWALIGLLTVHAIAHRTVIAAVWFAHEDPRPVAVLRIAVALLVVAWLIDLVPLLDYLFSSQGLTIGPRAQQMWGRNGPWSPLYRFDDPSHVQLYASALGVSAVCLAIGLATPIFKWTTWLLFVGLVGRNGLFAGGEHIFGFALFYLALSKCGATLSLDAMLRRRAGGPDTLPLIPAWPRHLLRLQLLALFCANGFAKFGPTWVRGDTAYFTFNHPHFRPADLLDLCAAVGPLPFRLATYVTHAFELLFFIALVGVAARLVAPHRALLPTGRRRFLARLLGVGIGATIVVLAHARLEGRARDSMVFSVAVGLGLTIVLGPIVVRLLGRLPRLRAWVLGRRLWVTLWIVFAGQLAFVLRIGWFASVTLALVVVMFEGEEIAAILRRLGLRPRPTATDHPPLSRLRRVIIAFVSVVQIVAALAIILPSERPHSNWRAQLEKPLHMWIRQTTLGQTWKMFAPSGATRVFELEATIIDADGQRWPVGDGLGHPDATDSRWGLDKREKLRRRLAHPRGRNSARRQHADYICRRFGPLPGAVEVELTGVIIPIPSPRALSKLGADGARQWAREHTQTSVLLSYPCP